MTASRSLIAVGWVAIGGLVMCWAACSSDESEGVPSVPDSAVIESDTAGDVVADAGDSGVLDTHVEEAAAADADAADVAADVDLDALVSCTNSTFPVDGQRCDRDAMPAGAYCRLTECATQCLDECHCNPDGRWKCFMYCRDFLGCGSPPLCGVGCGDSGAAEGGG